MQKTIAKLDKELQNAAEGQAKSSLPPLKAASSSMLTAVLQEVRKAKNEPDGAAPGPGPGRQREGDAAASELHTDASMPPMGAESSERSYR